MMDSFRVCLKKKKKLKSCREIGGQNDQQGRDSSICILEA